MKLPFVLLFALFSRTVARLGVRKDEVSACPLCLVLDPLKLRDSGLLGSGASNFFETTDSGVGFVGSTFQPYLDIKDISIRVCIDGTVTIDGLDIDTVLRGILDKAVELLNETASALSTAIDTLVTELPKLEESIPQLSETTVRLNETVICSGDKVTRPNGTVLDRATVLNPAFDATAQQGGVVTEKTMDEASLICSNSTFIDNNGSIIDLMEDTPIDLPLDTLDFLRSIVASIRDNADSLGKTQIDDALPVDTVNAIESVIETLEGTVTDIFSDLQTVEETAKDTIQLLNETIQELRDTIDGLLPVLLDPIIDLPFIDDIVTIASGAELRDLDDKRFNDVCNLLPLYDERCYFVLNPNGNLLSTLTASIAPFQGVINGAISSVSESVGELEGFQGSIPNLFSLLEGAEESCLVFNPEMIGVASSPGLLPPSAYDFCNCVSLRDAGTLACAVQVRYKGIALSVNDGLFYDLGERLAGDSPRFTFYDGFIESNFEVRGDIWTNLEIDVLIPSLILGGLKPMELAALQCSPLGAIELPFIPRLNLRISTLLDNDLNLESGSELLALAVLEEASIQFSDVITLSFGSAFVALRLNSASPECRPSGIFVSANVFLDLQIKGAMGQFLDNFKILGEVNLDLGITFSDALRIADLPGGFDDALDLLDVVQNVFLRIRVQSFSFLGIPLKVPEFGTTTAIEIEIQYLSKTEIARRKDYDVDACCIENKDFGATDCTLPFDAITTLIQSGKIEKLNSIALFFSVEQRLEFLGGVLGLGSIEFQLLFQLPDGPQSAFAIGVFVSAEIRALYIADIRALVGIQVRFDGQFQANFNVAVDLNVGVGELEVSLEAEALFTQDDSFIDADFELSFTTEWQTAKWLENLGAFIFDGLKQVFREVEAAWNAVTAFAGKVFDGIKKFVEEIGGAILGVLNAIEDVVDSLSDGLDSLTSILSGTGAGGALVAEVLDAVGDVAIAAVGAAVKIGKAILTGDFSSVDEAFAELGESIAGAFGFGRRVRNKELQTTEKFDPQFNCKLQFYKWRECRSFLGSTFDCVDKRGDTFPNELCVKQRSEEVVEISEMAELAKAQEDTKLASEARNQGLAYINQTDVSQVTDDLGARMTPTKQSLGSLSSMARNRHLSSHCQRLPFEVAVNELATTTAGISGDRSSATSTSNDCVDFSSNSSLGASLLDLQKQVAEEARDQSRGDQGLDKDPSLQNSTKIAGALCDQPNITQGADFKLDATITCDVNLTTFSFDSVFGSVILDIDPLCANPAPVRYVIASTQDPTEDGCAPSTMKIERFAVDCCRKKTDTFLHTLTIETLPPVFLNETGSLDVKLQCDSNIHPKELGLPDFRPGCADAVSELDILDSAPEFDQETCTTVITRTFVVTGDGCTDKEQSFNQTITLINEIKPEFDTFPKNLTIGVFDDYGTDATGFPSAFQRCGASPVEVTFSDEIHLGAFASERILTRTFTAKDLCGRESRRSQTITITNAVLPLGDKSLSKIYGGDKACVDDLLCTVGLSSCVIDGEPDCGVFGAPVDYECGSSNENEFEEYETFLTSLSTSLDLGRTQVSCLCPVGNAICDESFNSMDPEFATFGVQVVASSGICTELATQKEENNRGSVETRESNELLLTGLNSVYNLFPLSASDLNSKVISISAPSTSVVLVNVDGTNTLDLNSLGLSLDSEPKGVRVSGVGASHILWNMPDGIDYTVVGDLNVGYTWVGSVLNRRGTLLIAQTDNAEVHWTGQIFAKSIDAINIDFPCGYFTGFLPAQSVTPTPPSASPSQAVSEDDIEIGVGIGIGIGDGIKSKTGLNLWN